MTKVLLIEDDNNLSFMIAEGLEEQGFETHIYSNAEDAFRDFNKITPEIVLTDVNLEGETDGFKFARQLRLISNVPVIFITARTQIEDLKEGYQIGNMDYLKKPFGMSELVLRMNELLSRSPNTGFDNGWKQIGNYLFSPIEQCLQIQNEKIHLNPTEAVVLCILSDNIEKIVNKEVIGVAMNNYKEVGRLKNTLNEGTFYNAITTLREKLKRDQRIVLESISKTGYRLGIKID